MLWRARSVDPNLTPSIDPAHQQGVLAPKALAQFMRTRRPQTQIHDLPGRLELYICLSSHFVLQKHMHATQNPTERPLLHPEVALGGPVLRSRAERTSYPGALALGTTWEPKIGRNLPETPWKRTTNRLERVFSMHTSVSKRRVGRAGSFPTAFPTPSNMQHNLSPPLGKRSTHKSCAQPSCRENRYSCRWRRPPIIRKKTVRQNTRGCQV
jgi:hypothetical protein